MADIKILEDECDGERGPRGHRGHRGHDGDDGSTGPTGPTGSGSGAPTRQIFTSDGTYVPTPGTTSVRVLMSGGGGAGGGAGTTTPGVTAHSIGGGGGAGAALDFILDGPITGGPVVIGAGGTGNIENPGNDGLPSSVTINGTVFTAASGEGGGFALVVGTTGVAVAFGGITLSGSSAVDIVSGDDGMSGVHGDTTVLAGGNGGSGEFGIGGQGFRGFGSSSGDGLPGSGFGSGGGGAGSTGALGTTPPQTGGSGAPGVVIIEES